MFTANVACVCTLINLCCGFFAIILHLMGMDAYALSILLCGFFCDGLDGYLARKKDLTSAFGERLDSLADLMSFGMAPAMIALGSHEWSVGLISVVGLYLVCGAVRLARYDPEIQVLSFSGMPIPMAGLLLAAFSITSDFVPWFDLVPGLLGLLMVSDIPFLKLGFKGAKLLLPLGLGLVALIMLIWQQNVAIATLAFTAVYMLANLFIALVRDVQVRWRAMARTLANKTSVL